MWGAKPRKGVFEHAQNAHIRIHLAHAHNSSGPLLSIDTFYSEKWFCLRTAKASSLIRAFDVCLWPEGTFSFGASKMITYKRTPYSCVPVIAFYINLYRAMNLSGELRSIVDLSRIPASILRKSKSCRHRPVSYPDGPMTARYRFT